MWYTLLYISKFWKWKWKINRIKAANFLFDLLYWRKSLLLSIKCTLKEYSENSVIFFVRNLILYKRGRFEIGYSRRILNQSLWISKLNIPIYPYVVIYPWLCIRLYDSPNLHKLNVMFLRKCMLYDAIGFVMFNWFFFHLLLEMVFFFKF